MRLLIWNNLRRQESWSTMFKKAAQWNEKVRSGEIENPYVFEHSNEPEGYAY